MPHPLKIIARSNGSGLDRDAALVQRILTDAGLPTDFAHYRSRPWWAQFLPHFGAKAKAGVFLERVYSNWWSTAENFFTIPNQERFPRRHIGRLKKLKAVLCKTHAAEEVFARYGAQTRYIGFTSPDQLDARITPDYSRYLLIAGRSTEKGTTALLELWANHPQWPTLTLIQHKSNAPESVPANVKLISERITNAELTALYNSHGIHLCPSRCEGWGHTIVEAMSARALVITTNAPPMNELITVERGILVPYQSSAPRKLGTSYEISRPALATAIESTFAMPLAEKLRLATAARAWFEQNDREFKERLVSVVKEELGIK